MFSNHDFTSIQKLKNKSYHGDLFSANLFQFSPVYKVLSLHFNFFFFLLRNEILLLDCNSNI